jgi:Glyoxalase-like domain
LTARLRTITVDCARWEPLVEFWSQALDFVEDPDNPNNPGDPEGLLVSTRQDIALLFIPVPEAKSVKNRVHFDITPTDRTRDEEVERLLGLGATQVADHRRDDGTGWVTLADPEGNEFDVERSDAERAASASAP